jgi:hypothetical protein
MAMENRIFKVSGAGISVIGVWDASLRWTYLRIIELGGIPQVVEL